MAFISSTEQDGRFIVEYSYTDLASDRAFLQERQRHVRPHEQQRVLLSVRPTCYQA
jgi:hypothetical protein